MFSLPGLSVPDANKPALRPAVRTVSAVRERREALPGTETEQEEGGQNTGGGCGAQAHHRLSSSVHTATR